MADQLVVTGKYLGATKTESVGQNNFQVRKFYVDITTNAEWPNTPEFQLKGDKVSLVDHLQKGQTIQVKFNIDGRKFKNQQTGKDGVITNLTAWKIELVHMQSVGAVSAPPAQTPTPVPAPSPARTPAPVMPAFQPSPEDDDLPF